ncbi:hypothetical protein SALBM135S_08108 [Streptomyces alboniger]
MGLPAIASYPMPDPTVLPRPHISWRFEPVLAALLVHDTQNHYVGAFRWGVHLWSNPSTPSRPSRSWRRP